MQPRPGVWKFYMCQMLRNLARFSNGGMQAGVGKLGTRRPNSHASGSLGALLE